MCELKQLLSIIYQPLIWPGHISYLPLFQQIRVCYNIWLLHFALCVICVFSNSLASIHQWIIKRVSPPLTRPEFQKYLPLEMGSTSLEFSHLLDVTWVLSLKFDSSLQNLLPLIIPITYYTSYVYCQCCQISSKYTIMACNSPTTGGPSPQLLCSQPGLKYSPIQTSIFVQPFSTPNQISYPSTYTKSPAKVSLRSSTNLPIGYSIFKPL